MSREEEIEKLILFNFVAFPGAFIIIFAGSVGLL